MASRIDGLAGNRNVAIDNNLKPQADKSGQANKASASQTAAPSDTVALTAEAKSLNVKPRRQ